MGCVFKGFYTGVANRKTILNLRPKLWGVNSVSVEKLHDFEIIYPARGVRPLRPAPPPTHTAYGPETCVFRGISYRFEMAIIYFSTV